MPISRSSISVRNTVSVAPTITIMVQPQDVSLYDSAIIEIINDDMSQTLQAQVETSATGTSPWTTSLFDAFSNIGPNKTANEILDVRGMSFLRITGIATGAGLSIRISLSLLRDL